VDHPHVPVVANYQFSTGVRRIFAKTGVLSKWVGDPGAAGSDLRNNGRLEPSGKVHRRATRGSTIRDIGSSSTRGRDEFVGGGKRQLGLRVRAAPRLDGGRRWHRSTRWLRRGCRRTRGSGSQGPTRSLCRIGLRAGFSCTQSFTQRCLGVQWGSGRIGRDRSYQEGRTPGPATFRKVLTRDHPRQGQPRMIGRVGALPDAWSVGNSARHYNTPRSGPTPTGFGTGHSCNLPLGERGTALQVQ